MVNHIVYVPYYIYAQCYYNSSSRTFVQCACIMPKPSAAIACSSSHIDRPTENKFKKKLIRKEYKTVSIPQTSAWCRFHYARLYLRARAYLSTSYPPPITVIRRVQPLQNLYNWVFLRNARAQNAESPVVGPTYNNKQS